MSMQDNHPPEFTVIIPARYGSSRFPGKPLKLIAGKPMIQHVVERAHQSQARQVIVATDSGSIFETVKAFGGEACLTHAGHQSGTDRLHEVAVKLGLSDQAIVVNVQGDEPLIPPVVIDQVAFQLAACPKAVAATLFEKIDAPEVFADQNVVKVVTNQQGLALYFSRAAIPHHRDRDQNFPEVPLAHRHIGIYAYRVELLKRFVSWPVAALEAAEKLEQLRILANGEMIHVSEVLEPVPGGVDTPEDLKLLESHLSSSTQTIHRSE